MDDLRDVVFDKLVDIAKEDKNIIFLCNDMDVFSLIEFKKNFPKRVINIGVAEQNLINMAAGLSSRGFLPIIYGILPFIIFRCYEQIKFNIDSMKLKALYIGIGTGHSFSWDGPTHYGVNDIGLVNNLSNTIISNPIDKLTALNSLKKFFKLNKSMFLRIEKQKFNNLQSYGNINDGFRFIKKSEKSEKLIITTGLLSHEIIKIKDIKKNIDIIDLFYINHFNKKKLKNVIKKYNFLSIVDESYLGSSLIDILGIETINGVNLNLFIPKNNQNLFYGSRMYPLKKYNLIRKSLDEYF